MILYLFLTLTCPRADSLFSHGLFADAATEYQRFLWQTPDSTGITRLKLGLSLGAAGEMNAAHRELRRVAAEHPELNEAAGRALAGLYALRRKYDLARVELLEMVLFVQDSARASRLYSDLAWLDLMTENAAGAAEYLRKAGRNDIVSDLTQPVENGNRSPTVAVLLSTFLPGSGELYAGRPLTGLASFVVTGGSAAGTYFAAKSGDWITASALFSLFFLRFYTGSRRNAAEFCLERQRSAAARRTAEVRLRYDLEPRWFAPAENLTGLKLCLKDQN